MTVTFGQISLCSFNLQPWKMAPQWLGHLTKSQDWLFDELDNMAVHCVKL